MNPNNILDDFCDWLKKHGVRFPVTILVHKQFELVCQTNYHHLSEFSYLLRCSGCSEGHPEPQIKRICNPHNKQSFGLLFLCVKTHP